MLLKEGTIGQGTVLYTGSEVKCRLAIKVPEDKIEVFRDKPIDIYLYLKFMTAKSHFRSQNWVFSW